VVRQKERHGIQQAGPDHQAIECFGNTELYYHTTRSVAGRKPRSPTGRIRRIPMPMIVYFASRNNTIVGNILGNDGRNSGRCERPTHF
jgi:hypothetical protein